MKKTKLTQADLFREFNTAFAAEKRREKTIDFPALSFAWGQLKDTHCKNGNITPFNYQTWNYPKWIKRKK